jgi:hypothetical protein
VLVLSRSVLGGLACLSILVLLAGCAGHRTQISSSLEAAQYAAHARRNYVPPGPPGDPWGPYIVEAAQRFDVPERWVREVMRQESDGQLYEHGQLITSSAGAMGLMQVMPETYDMLRSRYALGDDPYDPHDNILAGTAYIREMYDIYGSPGFLAAYNAGPARLDDYLTRNRPLPDETRHYVARIGPNIIGVQPQRPSPASGYAMNQVPLNIPPGPRYPRGRSGGAPVALAENRGDARPGQGRGGVATTPLPLPPPPPPLLVADNQPASRSGFSLIPRAMADTPPAPHGGAVVGHWAIQVGAFGSVSDARAAAAAARGQAREALASAHPAVATVRQAHAVLYRARLTGLSREAALQACQRIGRSRTNCIVLSPGAQSS